MGVFKINKTKDYTIMSNYHLKDKRLSLKSKGLLSLMLSLPDDWDYSINGLTKICKENETAIKNALDELKQFNYLIVTKLNPNETDSGRYEYIYDIYEIPQEQKQGGGFLGVEFLCLENQGKENTNNKINNINNIYNNVVVNNIDIMEVASNEFINITPMQYEMLIEYEKKYGKSIILLAIKECVLHNVKNFAYLDAILKSWDGKTYEQIVDMLEKYKNKKINNNSNNPKKTEWLDYYDDIKNDDYNITEEEKIEYGIE